MPIRGYLAVPSGEVPAPAVLLIHETLGVDDFRQEVTRRLATEGFVTLTPDLFVRTDGPPREYTDAQERRRKAFLSAQDDQAIADLTGAFRYLTTRSDVDSTRVAVLGFCMGGGIAFALACRATFLTAAVVFYGLLDLPAEFTPDCKIKTRLPLAASLSCPLMAHYGDADEVIPMAQVRALSEALTNARKEFVLHVYHGAPHAFYDDPDPRFCPQEAQRAWKRSVTFLREHLGQNVNKE
jgi:carboxymethylenebutenolidase